MYSMPSTNLAQLEETLLKRAAEYADFDDMEGQLTAEAKTYGASDNDAAAVAKQVMKRLKAQNAAVPVQGNQLGKAWDITKIAKRIKDMRY